MGFIVSWDQIRERMATMAIFGWGSRVSPPMSVHVQWSPTSRSPRTPPPHARLWLWLWGQPGKANSVFCCLREQAWPTRCGKTSAGARTGASASPPAAAWSQIGLNQGACLV